MSRRYSMDRRAAESDATRRAILDAVVDVAAHSGLDATTIQEVASRADLAVRTVYNHFGSRDELVTAALADLAERTRASVRAIEVELDSPRAELLAFVDAYLSSYEDQGPGVRVLLGASGVDLVDEAVGEIRSWRRRQLRAILRRAQDDETLALPLADAVDVAYLATAYGTFASLTTDAQRSPAAARSVVASIVERTIFAA